MALAGRTNEQWAMNQQEHMFRRNDINVTSGCYLRQEILKSTLVMGRRNITQTLLPIMQSLGVDPGQPDVQQVHNTIIR